MLKTRGWRTGKRPFQGDPLGKGHPFIHGSHEGESNLAAGVGAGVTLKG